MINEDDRLLTFSRELGDHNARLKALEGKWEQVHQDLREIRDLIRQQNSGGKTGSLELALHHFAESVTKSVAAPPAPPVNLRTEIAQAIHENRNNGGWLMPFAVGALSVIALLLAYKQFLGG